MWLVLAEQADNWGFRDWFNYGVPTALLLAMVAILVKCLRWVGTNTLIPIKDSIIKFVEKLSTQQDEIGEQQKLQTDQMRLQTSQMELQKTMLETLHTAVKEHTSSIREFSVACRNEYEK